MTFSNNPSLSYSHNQLKFFNIFSLLILAYTACIMQLFYQAVDERDRVGESFSNCHSNQIK